MNTLQTRIAELFADAYSPDNWTRLLPRLIDHQLKEYYRCLENYQRELLRWQQGDPSTPAPQHPTLPAEYNDACQVLAIQEGFDFQALACCFYAAKYRIGDYGQKVKLAG
jgi:hypothetical protein